MSSFFDLDLAGDSPVYLQIADHIRRQIMSGDIALGQSLPTVRVFAKQLGVSVQTVFNAYQALRRDGLVSSRTRRGTVVTVTNRRKYAQSVVARLDAESGPIMQFERVTRAAGMYSMATEMADPSLFQHDDFFAEFAVVGRAPSWEIAPGPIEGEGRVRETVAAFLTATGLQAPSSCVRLVNSELAAVGIALRAVTDPGETVLVHEPLFMSPLELLACLERRAAMFRLDGDSFDPEGFGEAIKRHGCRWLVVKPHFGGLSATRMSTTGLRRLRDTCELHGVKVIELDTTRLWTSGPVPVPLWASNPEETIVVHALSDHLTLGMGLAALVVPAKHRGQVSASLLSSGASVPSWLQSAFGRFVSEGRLANHLERLNARVQVRMQALLNSVSRLSHYGLSAQAPEGGHRVWCRLPRGMLASELYAKATGLGVAILPGPVKLTGDDAEQWIGLSCSVLEPSQLASATALLAKAMEAA